jgi:hypothetical protein
MGNDNHVAVSHKLGGVQGRVGGPLVMMKEPVVVMPKFRPFSLHILSSKELRSKLCGNAAHVQIFC